MEVTVSCCKQDQTSMILASSQTLRFSATTFKPHYKTICWHFIRRSLQLIKHNTKGTITTNVPPDMGDSKHANVCSVRFTDCLALPWITSSLVGQLFILTSPSSDSFLNETLRFVSIGSYSTDRLAPWAILAKTLGLFPTYHCSFYFLPPQISIIPFLKTCG